MHGEEDRATHIRTDIISYVYMSILDAILSGAQLDSYPSLGPNYAQTCWTCCSFQSFMYCTILFEQHHTSCTQISLEILTYMCLPHPSCDAFSLRCISYIPCDALCLFQHLLLSCLAFICLVAPLIIYFKQSYLFLPCFDRYILYLCMLKLEEITFQHV